MVSATSKALFRFRRVLYGGAAPVTASLKRLLAEADRHAAARDYSAALELLEAIVADAGGAPPPIVFLKLSKVHRVRGDIAAAAAVNADGRSLHPGHSGLAIDAAQLAMASADWTKAAQLWAAIVDDEAITAPATAHLGLAKARRRAGDLKGAIAALERGLERLPDDEALASELTAATKLRDREAVQAAIEDPRRPLDMSVAYAVARDMADQNDWGAAVELLESLAERAGDALPARQTVLLSSGYRRLDRAAEANATINAGIEAHPNDVSLAVEHARIAMSGQDWREALTRWQNVLDRFERELPASAFRNAAATAAKCDELDLAEAFASIGVSHHPDNPALIAEHARIATLRYDWGQSSVRWSRVLQLENGDLDWLTDHQVARAGTAFIEAGEAERAISLMKDVRSKRGDRKLFLAVEGIALLRLDRFDEAREHWMRFWRLAGRGAPHFGQEQRLHHVRPLMGNAAIKEAVPNEVIGGQPQLPRMCVYTVAFGGYDRVRAPTYRPPGIDFICFTDSETEVDGWEVRRIEPPDPRRTMASRKIKIEPYNFLPDYDYSIYVDANVLILCDVEMLVRRWLAGKRFVAWTHPERADAYHEIEAVLAFHRHRPEPMITYYARLRDEGYPSDQGLVEATFLWRDHGNEEIRSLMKAWWQGVQETAGRDQPPLSKLMWETGIRPETLPPQFGVCGFNDFYWKLPHLRSPVEADTDDGNGSEASTKTARSASVVSNKRRPLVFVYREADVQTATMMRGEQLSGIARRALKDARDVRYLEAAETIDLQGSVAVLTRSFLKRAKATELGDLRSRDNIVCVDNVDHHADAKLHECVDVYIAASLGQYLHYLKTISDREIRLVTHHADVAIDDAAVPTDRARIGYFGELVNARHIAELADAVDFVQTSNVAVTDRGWLEKLPQYNVHYAVRQERRGDVFKPFTKGFTAARCGANIIVPLNEGDARHYLTADYPFILADNKIATVREAIAYVSDCFGGREWERGLDIMASVRERSSPVHIAGEISALLAAID